MRLIVKDQVSWTDKVRRDSISDDAISHVEIADFSPHRQTGTVWRASFREDVNTYLTAWGLRGVVLRRPSESYY